MDNQALADCPGDPDLGITMQSVWEIWEVIVPLIKEYN